MPVYTLRTSRGVDRALERLPEFAATAIVEFITGRLLENPYRLGRALSHEFEGYRGARVGLYRVVYRVIDEERVVRVTWVDHRADVYRPR